MASTSKIVLLSCGSFNPITNMHLRMFELAKDSLQKTGRYKVIGGVISPTHDGYNKKELATAKHRLAMSRLAAKSSDWIKVDHWETEQTGWVTTRRVLDHQKHKLDSIHNANIDDVESVISPSKKRKTSRSPRKQNNTRDEIDFSLPNNINLNDNSPVRLKLLCGADLLESFSVPGLWSDDDIEEIVGSYGIVVISRAGSNPEKFIYESDVLYRNQENIHIVTEWISNDISSTKIRRALKREESVKYLLQDSVIDYVEKHGLYTPNKPTTDNKYINHITPSPNREDGNILPNVDFLSPNSSYSSTGTNTSGYSSYASDKDSPPKNNDSPQKFMKNIAESPIKLKKPESPGRKSGSPKSSGRHSSGSPRHGPRSPRKLTSDDEESPKLPRRSNPGCMSDLSNIVKRIPLIERKNLEKCLPRLQALLKSIDDIETEVYYV